MHIFPGVWLMMIGMFLKSSAQNQYCSFELRFGLQQGAHRKRDIAA